MAIKVIVQFYQFGWHHQLSHIIALNGSWINLLTIDINIKVNMKEHLTKSKICSQETITITNYIHHFGFSVMLVLFFWVWNLVKSYFSELANFWAIFLGFAKFPYFWVWRNFSYYFGSSNFCITHLNLFDTKHTMLKIIISR